MTALQAVDALPRNIKAARAGKSFGKRKRDRQADIAEADYDDLFITHGVFSSASVRSAGLLLSSPPCRPCRLGALPGPRVSLRCLDTSSSPQHDSLGDISGCQ